MVVSLSWYTHSFMEGKTKNMRTYGKPKPDRTGIERWYTMGQPFFYTDENGDEWQTTRPSIELLFDNGYIPKVFPVLVVHERQGAMTTPIPATEITYEVETWTQEEIDAETLAELNEQLLLISEASSELSYYTSKTAQELTNKTNLIPDTFAGHKQAHEQSSQAIRQIAIILKQLRNTGRLGA